MNSDAASDAIPSILVVDDKPLNLHLLLEMLRRHGFRVRPVPNGELALKAARLEPPELILLDIKLPGMDGYEVCGHLKADENLREIPVIFISGLNQVIDKVKAFKAGGVDYVTKPFKFEEVEARVRTHLELARLRRAMEHHSARLEEIVALRTRELAQANARLALLDKAKSDFLSLISHEIRTPLCGVFGAAELLLASCAEAPGVLEYRELYEQSRQRLVTLIDDALMLTELGAGAGAGDNQQCRLDELLERACEQATPLAQSRLVHLAPPPFPPSLVKGVSDYLVRALRALLETAVKLCNTGASVRLALAAQPGEIGLIIESEGKTVPPHALARFFDLLAVGEPISGADDLGLAPALAERIVTLCGGSVSVANLAPPGIRLVVRLRTTESE